jgi:hypothetical protein
VSNGHLGRVQWTSGSLYHLDRGVDVRTAQDTILVNVSRHINPSSILSILSLIFTIHVFNVSYPVSASSILSFVLLAFTLFCIECLLSYLCIFHLVNSPTYFYHSCLQCLLSCQSIFHIVKCLCVILSIFFSLRIELPPSMTTPC